ncbi:hypothetical protein HPB48_018834 [Haemaphysalis longicornis]|uniref:Uncharacterized protein n=1 Tax=Haemaphysalis longicornis TaxID=44386 RepID=A0A9J6FYI9_HAELO|nr:hypothetical protein HPB48_018834 [Haemaphysalis longicornis]
MDDPELRRAINGHLPDDSQLWLTDELVDLQPGIFDALDKEHLRVESKRDSFKQFLGMYLVWALSPFVSNKLHKAMLNDMGVKGSDRSRRISTCSRTVSEVMPLVGWKVLADMLGENKLLTRQVFRLVVNAIVKFLGTYSASLELEAAAITSHLRFNVMNLSLTWSLLDGIYAFVPVESAHGSFFERYRRAARASAVVYKASLRRPHQNVYHMTGVSREPVYRLLVTREIGVKLSFQAPPLVHPEHPIAVPLATLGPLVATRILSLLYLVFMFDERFVSIETRINNMPARRDAQQIKYRDGARHRIRFSPTSNVVVSIPQISLGGRI